MSSSPSSRSDMVKGVLALLLLGVSTILGAPSARVGFCPSPARVNARGGPLFGASIPDPPAGGSPEGAGTRRRPRFNRTPKPKEEGESCTPRWDSVASTLGQCTFACCCGLKPPHAPSTDPCSQSPRKRSSLVRTTSTRASLLSVPTGGAIDETASSTAT